jgi:hypothetical protein
MTSKLAVLSGAALALLMVASLAGPTDARQGGGHGFGGGGHGFSGSRMDGVHMGGPRMGARGFAASPRFDHRRNFHHRRVFIGAPFAYGSYYYGSGCDWLRRNALYSGSPYWWNRYYACINGYGY